MFYYTFSNYARRTATFKVGGATVSTSSALIDPYATKIGSTGTPSTNPTVDATTASQVAPTYNATVRTINAPTGTYANAIWYRTDGTSCAVATPTPDCGAQTPATYVSFPNTTEWTPTTSTEHGSVTFYAGSASATVSNTTVTGWDTVELVPQTATIALGGRTTALAAGTNISSWFTNLPAGLIATVPTAVPAGASTIPIRFTGTPAENSTSTMVITIPASALQTNAALDVTTNPNAVWHIATPLATMSPATITGWTGTALANDQTLTISLTDTAINNGVAFRTRLAAGTDVTNWFTNIPAGLNATLAVPAETSDTSVTVVFNGTPTTNSTDAITATIPGSQLTSSLDLEVSSNPGTVWDVTTPAANLANITVTGAIGTPLTPQTAILQLINTSFIQSIPAGTDITSWFTNLPAGLKVTVSQSALPDDNSIQMTFSGTPTATSSNPINFTIPAAYLISGNDLTATTNVDATYHITNAPPKVPNTGVLGAGSSMVVFFGVIIGLIGLTTVILTLKRRKI